VKDETNQLLEGSLVGNSSNWRKARFVRKFSETELKLLSGGSAWNFEYDQGSFEANSLSFAFSTLLPSLTRINLQVEFHADGANHFVCKQYPAHSHWSMDGDRIIVNWGSYGDYELTIDATGCNMAGCKKGQPDNWRRATFLRSLGPEGLASAPHHDHDH
jgi:hypothetical protein